MVVKCAQCQHFVSDIATVCPHCGAILINDSQDQTPASRGSSNEDIAQSIDPPSSENSLEDLPQQDTISQQLPPPASDSQFEDSGSELEQQEAVYVPHYDESDYGGKKSNKGQIVALIITLLVVVAIGGWFFYDNAQTKAKLEAERHRTDSIAAVLEAEKARQDSIAAAEKARQDSIIAVHNDIIYKYETIVKNRKNEGYGYESGCSYYLYDMTKDGIPELIVQNNPDPDNGYAPFSIFAYQDGNVRELYSGYSLGFLRMSNGCFYSYWWEYDDDIYTKYTYSDGVIKTREIPYGDLNTNLVPVEWVDRKNLRPIDDMFK